MLRAVQNDLTLEALFVHKLSCGEHRFKVESLSGHSLCLPLLMMMSEEEQSRVKNKE